MTDLVERLRAQPKEDHIRGCMGRQYTCDCGYDLKTEGLLEMAAAEIERLRAIEDASINAATYFHMGGCGEEDFDEQRMVNLMARLGRALEPKPQCA